MIQILELGFKKNLNPNNSSHIQPWWLSGIMNRKVSQVAVLILTVDRIPLGTKVPMVKI